MTVSHGMFVEIQSETWGANVEKLFGLERVFGRKVGKCFLTDKKEPACLIGLKRAIPR